MRFEKVPITFFKDSDMEAVRYAKESDFALDFSLVCFDEKDFGLSSISYSPRDDFFFVGCRQGRELTEEEVSKYLEFIKEEHNSNFFEFDSWGTDFFNEKNFYKVGNGFVVVKEPIGREYAFKEVLDSESFDDFCHSLKEDYGLECFKSNMGKGKKKRTILNIKNSYEHAEIFTSRFSDELDDFVLSFFSTEVENISRMLEGSLSYKTREAGRKDGTGRIIRPW